MPGQFLSVTATIGGDEITRAYSVVSAPGGSGFALCANLVQEGRLSPWLFALSTGGEIDFKGPYGAFILRRPVSDGIFVATRHRNRTISLQLLISQLDANPERSASR